MSTYVQRIKYIKNQIKRFRYRKGYGVHSPFAFRFITEVINESSPYYSYIEIENIKTGSGEKKNKLDCKVLKLVFRLVNQFQPRQFLEVGSEPSLEFPVTLAKRNIQYLYKETLFSIKKEEPFLADFVFIHHIVLEEDFETLKNSILNTIHSNSLLVISGVGYSKKMKTLWKNIQEDKRVGITFDLYDVGLVFLDLKMNKQHYIVNF